MPIGAKKMLMNYLHTYTSDTLLRVKTPEQREHLIQTETLFSCSRQAGSRLPLHCCRRLFPFERQAEECSETPHTAHTGICARLLCRDGNKRNLGPAETANHGVERRLNTTGLIDVPNQSIPNQFTIAPKGTAFSFRWLYSHEMRK